MSFWTMGFNQHTRGVWCNNLVYNLHLLTGKIATPGNSPFSLTGQPSACGTAREVGTFSHRLPADMVVTNPKHRASSRGDLEASAGTIPDKPGFHAVLQNRMLKDGKLNAYWVMVNNNMQAGAEPDAGGAAGVPQSGQLHRRLGGLSDGDRAGRRPDPADGDVGREGRRVRQRGAAHAVLAPARRRARRGALGPVAARRVLEAVQGGGGVAGGADREKARDRGQDALSTCCTATATSTSFPRRRSTGLRNDEAKAFGFYLQKGLFEEYATFGRGHGHDLRRSTLPQGARPALAGGRTARRHAGAIAKAPIPMSRRARAVSSTATPTAAR